MVNCHSGFAERNFFPLFFPLVLTLLLYIIRHLIGFDLCPNEVENISLKCTHFCFSLARVMSRALDLKVAVDVPYLSS